MQREDKLDLYTWAKLEWKMYTEIYGRVFSKDALLCSVNVLASGISGVEKHSKKFPFTTVIAIKLKIVEKKISQQSVLYLLYSLTKQ